MHGVVPFAVEGISDDRHCVQLGVADLHAGGTGAVSSSVRPVWVVVVAMDRTTTSWLFSGLPRRFMVIAESSRCSILFHFDVPGGMWQTVTARPDSAANRASSALKLRVR